MSVDDVELEVGSLPAEGEWIEICALSHRKDVIIVSPSRGRVD